MQPTFEEFKNAYPVRLDNAFQALRKGRLAWLLFSLHLRVPDYQGFFGFGLGGKFCLPWKFHRIYYKNLYEHD